MFNCVKGPFQTLLGTLHCMYVIAGHFYVAIYANIVITFLEHRKTGNNPLVCY